MYISIIITYILNFVNIRAQIKENTSLKYMVELSLLYVNVFCKNDSLESSMGKK